MSQHEIDQAKIEVESKKWRDELQLREREVAVKEREQTGREEELRLKNLEQRRSRWTNPLVLAVLAAAVAAAGNALVALVTAREQQRAEQAKWNQERSLGEAKAEADRILEVVKTNNDPDKAATNLTFLIDAGLIQNDRTKVPLAKYLKDRKPGEGVTLPASATVGIPPTLEREEFESLQSANLAKIVRFAIISSNERAPYTLAVIDPFHTFKFKEEPEELLKHLDPSFVKFTQGNGEPVWIKATAVTSVTENSGGLGARKTKAVLEMGEQGVQTVKEDVSAAREILTSHGANLGEVPDSH